MYCLVTAQVPGNEVYMENPTEMSPDYSCADGDTPLGFQCISMTYPELTTDINDYPCFTVNNVTGRHIEVLVSELKTDHACMFHA